MRFVIPPCRAYLQISERPEIYLQNAGEIQQIADVVQSFCSTGSIKRHALGVEGQALEEDYKWPL